MKVRVNHILLARRCVQLSVVALLVLIPAVARYNNYLSARELDRVIEKWDGSSQAALLRALDAAVRSLPNSERTRGERTERDRRAVLAKTQNVRGSVWSMQLGPISMTDPLAAVESVAGGRRFPRVLAWSLLVPVVLTLLFGRVFCSWICPMGLLLEWNDKLRGLLKFLELHPRNLRGARGTKYGLLVVGVLLAALLSVPVLGYVYPPAILSREAHDLVFAWFDRAEHGRAGISLGSLSWMSLIVLAIIVLELTVSRRWWCRYVCPGGALYGLIGWARLLRVRLKHDKCTDCAVCVAACPMGLNPMKNEMGIECDNCGVCISSCGDSALVYGIDGPLVPQGSHEAKPAAVASA